MHKIEMLKSIVAYVNFYFSTYKTKFYPNNFIKACLVYQFLYAKYFTQKLDINQIIYRLSDSRHNCRSISPTLDNHLIFSLAFREFWKQYRLGRGCVYTINSPFIPGRSGLSDSNFEMSFTLTGYLIPFVFKLFSYCFKSVNRKSFLSLGWRYLSTHHRKHFSSLFRMFTIAFFRMIQSGRGI